MVTFESGDLVIRIPNKGSFEDFLSLNRSLFEAYGFALSALATDSDGFSNSSFIFWLRYLADALNEFETPVMFAVDKTIKALEVRKDVQA